MHLFPRSHRDPNLIRPGETHTHARAYTPLFFPFPPNPANYTQKVHTQTLAYTHWAIRICVSQYTNPYLIERKGKKKSV